MDCILKMSKMACIAFAFCFANTCFSQENFKKGYIIRQGGNTLSGLVDYREGFRSYRICQFKSLPDQSIATYTPDDIMGYGLTNGRAFQTREIKDAARNKSVVFLDVKVVGLISLYKHEGSLFVQKAGDSLQRISNDKTEKLMNGKLVARSSNQHIAVLSTLLFDCVSLRERTQNVSFIERNITALLEDYNVCRGAENVTLNATKPWAKVMIGLTAGLHLSTLEVKQLTHKYVHLAGKYEMTRTPMIGVSFDVLAPRLSERLSFHGAVLYLRPTYKLDKVLQYSLSKHSNQVEINTNQLKFPVGFRYTFPGEKVAPYLNFGISTTINFASSSTWHQHIKYTTTVEESHNTDVWPTRTNQMGYWGGAGIVVSINQKLGAFLEIRYEQNQTFSNARAMAAGLWSEMKNVQLIAGIRRK